MLVALGRNRIATNMMRRCFGLLAAAPPPPFAYSPMFPCDAFATTPWRLLTKDFVSTVPVTTGDPSLPSSILKVDTKALTLLSKVAFSDMAHLLRPGHLQQLRNIIDDAEASDNDKYVSLQLLKNAGIAAGRVLPGCQDTGSPIIAGYKGDQVWTVGEDGEEAALSRGVYKTYTQTYLRFSQMAPLTTFDEKNTGSNLPGQIEINATKGAEYKFVYLAKGGGSANKSYLFQETKAILNPKSMRTFLAEKIAQIGTAACPPYHLAIVIGGTSAELCLKTCKYASIRYLDGLPTKGDMTGHAIRDPTMEAEVLKICQDMGMGAQFGGKYFAHDVRVIRLPRHGASLPVAIGVSCSADRQVLGKINSEGVWIEQLEEDPARFLPEITEKELLPTPAVAIDLNQPMDKVRALLSTHKCKTRLSLTGTIVVARDIAHAKLRERLEAGEPLPDYFKNHVVYYAGPAKCPEGMPSGSFGPTTAGRMDAFVDVFQKAGGSFVMLAKGNRSDSVTRACKANGGFYLGSIGGPAAVLATESIKKVEVLDMPELGMEAVWKIDVVDFPAFIVVDDKGNDFFKQLKD
jgi:fumarate hydratase class I